MEESGEWRNDPLPLREKGNSVPINRERQQGPSPRESWTGIAVTVQRLVALTPASTRLQVGMEACGDEHKYRPSQANTKKRFTIQRGTEERMQVWLCA